MPVAKTAKKTRTAAKAKAPVRLKAVKPKAKAKPPIAPAAKAVSGSQATLLGFKPYKEKKGEPYMNDKQAAHFRSILLAWKKQLMEEVDRTVHHMQDEAANPPDPADRATLEEEFSIELRTRDRE
ncbi:MAG: RNA polymerase-binding protein DksA, partial [Gammaproteobacteria bacterium]